MNIKTLLLTALAATSLAASADVYVNRRNGCGRNGDWIRVSYRHVPLSDPNDPFHVTYKRNTLRTMRRGCGVRTGTALSTEC